MQSITHASVDHCYCGIKFELWEGGAAGCRVGQLSTWGAHLTNHKRHLRGPPPAKKESTHTPVASKRSTFLKLLTCPMEPLSPNTPLGHSTPIVGGTLLHFVGNCAYQRMTDAHNHITTRLSFCDSFLHFRKSLASLQL